MGEVEGTLYMLSGNPSAPPEIGDMRVSFQRIPCGEATVLAVQNGDSFVPMKWTARLGEGHRVALGGEAEDLDSDPELLGGCVCCSAPCTCIGKTVAVNEEVFQIAPGRR